jgi:ketosteroid isomerase-like protein
MARSRRCWRGSITARKSLADARAIGAASRYELSHRQINPPEAIIMSAEQNAKLVTKTWQDVIAGNVDAATADMSDEVSWVIPGNLPGVSGLKRGKAAVKEFIGGIRKAFPAGLNSQISKVHSAGDTVIVELTNTGKAFNGRDYRNEYCFVFEIEGGKIRRIREYVDLLTVKETLM